MVEPDLLAALRPVIAALERLGIGYYLGGSVASSYYGVVRATLDADLVAAVGPEHAAPLAAALSDAYYVDAEMIRDAAARGRMFNVVHLGTALKIDVYVLRAAAWDQAAFERRQAAELVVGAPPLQIGSPEDIVLHKLLWYRMGGEVSDRQWKDVLGVLRMRGADLDVAYLERWALALGIADLLARVRREADHS